MVCVGVVRICSDLLQQFVLQQFVSVWFRMKCERADGVALVLSCDVEEALAVRWLLTEQVERDDESARRSWLAHDATAAALLRFVTQGEYFHMRQAAGVVVA